MAAEAAVEMALDALAYHLYRGGYPTVVRSFVYLSPVEAFFPLQYLLRLARLY